MGRGITAGKNRWNLPKRCRNNSRRQRSDARACVSAPRPRGRRSFWRWRASRRRAVFRRTSRSRAPRSPAPTVRPRWSSRRMMPSRISPRAFRGGRRRASVARVGESAPPRLAVGAANPFRPLGRSPHPQPGAVPLEPSTPPWPAPPWPAVDAPEPPAPPSPEPPAPPSPSPRTPPSLPPRRHHPPPDAPEPPAPPSPSPRTPPSLPPRRRHPPRTPPSLPPRRRHPRIPDAPRAPSRARNDARTSARAPRAAPTTASCTTSTSITARCARRPRRRRFTRASSSSPPTSSSSSHPDSSYRRWRTPPRTRDSRRMPRAPPSSRSGTARRQPSRSSRRCFAGATTFHPTPRRAARLDRARRRRLRVRRRLPRRGARRAGQRARKRRSRVGGGIDAGAVANRPDAFLPISGGPDDLDNPDDPDDPVADVAGVASLANEDADSARAPLLGDHPETDFDETAAEAYPHPLRGESTLASRMAAAFDRGGVDVEKFAYARDAGAYLAFVIAVFVASAEGSWRVAGSAGLVGSYGAYLVVAILPGAGHRVGEIHRRRRRGGRRRRRGSDARRGCTGRRRRFRRQLRGHHRGRRWDAAARVARRGRGDDGGERVEARRDGPSPNPRRDGNGNQNRNRTQNLAARSRFVGRGRWARCSSPWRRCPPPRCCASPCRNWVRIPRGSPAPSRCCRPSPRRALFRDGRANLPGNVDPGGACTAPSAAPSAPPRRGARGPRSRDPKRRARVRIMDAVLTAVALVISVAWLDAVSGELVALVAAVAKIRGVSDAVVRATASVWARGAAAATVNVIVAKQGRPTMAVAACFAQPAFHLAGAVGTGFLARALPSAGARRRNPSRAPGRDGRRVRGARRVLSVRRLRRAARARLEGQSTRRRLCAFPGYSRSSPRRTRSSPRASSRGKVSSDDE